MQAHITYMAHSLPERVVLQQGQFILTRGQACTRDSFTQPVMRKGYVRIPSRITLTIRYCVFNRELTVLGLDSRSPRALSEISCTVVLEARLEEGQALKAFLRQREQYPLLGYGNFSFSSGCFLTDLNY
jgi:hypothetical protein